MRPLPSLMMTGAPLALLAVLGPRYGGELTVGAPRAVADRLVRSLVDETLLRITADGTLTAGLAELSPPAADADAVLTLREGASFHDGRPVRAADAVASLQGFLRSTSVAAQTLARAVVGIEALDDRRLVLRLDGPRRAALFALAAPAAALSATGPFVPTLAVAGRRASVRAFAGHVRGRPYLDTVTVVTLPGESEAARALRDGRVDAAVGAPGVSTPAATLVLVLDPTRSPFDAPALRAAVDATVGRAGLASLLATDALPPTLLLMEADAPAPSPTVALGHGTAVTLGVEEGVPALASQRVVATLGALGLRVIAASRGDAEVRAASDPARLLLFLPEVNEPALVLRELRSLVPGRSRADEALDGAEREAAGEARRALLGRAEAALREEHACLALIRWPVSFGAAAGIHGARLEPDGRLVLEDAWREAGS